MKTLGLAIFVTAGLLLTAEPTFCEAATGQGQAVVTILPSHPEAPDTKVVMQDVKLKINGKSSTVTQWSPLRGPASPVELVFLIDGSARASLGSELSDLANFVKEMPADTKIAVGYMENGRAAMAGPLSSDSAQVLNELHLPGGSLGSSASPYFCLSDLAKNWPSTDRSARREVVLITDGVDPYEAHYDPDDPYVQAGISDSIRAGLVVYSIYWRSQGRFDNTQYAANDGQNLLDQLTQATGGFSYWQGTGNPVSFGPYLTDLRRRLRNQYGLSFTSELNGKPQLENMQLKVSVSEAKVYAPQHVFVAHSGTAGE
jgi:hypothetical protein